MRQDRDLDRELRELGSHVEYPPVPDLAGSVRGRLETEAGSSESPSRARPQLWWIAAAALVLLMAVPVVSLAIRDTGGGAFSGAGGAGGGGATESGRQERGDPVGPTRLAEEDESLAAGASGKAREGGTQEAIVDGGDAAGQTGRPNGPVPDVVGMELVAACEKLSAKEYVGYVIRAIDDPGARPGLVVGQRPLAGRKGYVGGPVDLTVSEPYPEEELRRLSGGRNPACLDATGQAP